MRVLKFILPSVAIWMHLKGIMLSKINQTEKNNYCITLLICGIFKIQQINEYNIKGADSQIERKTCEGEGQHRGRDWAV